MEHFCIDCGLTEENGAEFNVSIRGHKYVKCNSCIAYWGRSGKCQVPSVRRGEHPVIRTYEENGYIVKVLAPSPTGEMI